MADLPVCDRTGLARLWCCCPDHESFTMTPAERHMVSGGVHHVADLERAAGRPLPEVRYTRRTPVLWQEPRPRSTVCDESHSRPPGAALCHECSDLLDRLRADAPALLLALHEAVIKDVAFAQLGAPATHADPETGALIEESPVPFNAGASDALREVKAALQVRPVSAQLAALSAAARRAHQVVDRPRDDIRLGKCPMCGAAISMPRPGHHDIAAGHVMVTCPACTYRASWADHQRVILDQAGDTPLTIGEIVGVLTQGGEPVARKRIEYLVARHGLPRERMTRLYRRGHELVFGEVWVYRLRDVRELQAKLDGGA
ncbi:MAG: hypothetical protein QM708_12125 [Propioniciclava sp.]|uniref:hypothetical protein n=1 Tax=Propioniciclava sp. TaxID=2038686 RepID=UPI0039E21EF5